MKPSFTPLFGGIAAPALLLLAAGCIPPPPNPTIELTATQTEILIGESIDLNWSTQTNVNDPEAHLDRDYRFLSTNPKDRIVYFNDPCAATDWTCLAQPQSGMFTKAPTRTTTYTLTAVETFSAILVDLIPVPLAEYTGAAAVTVTVNLENTTAALPIADANLKACVEATGANTQDIISLDCSAMGITSVEGLQFLQFLEHLDISNNPGLTSIRALNYLNEELLATANFSGTGVNCIDQNTFNRFGNFPNTVTTVSPQCISP